MGADNRRPDQAGQRYLIVADIGKKLTEIIEYRGDLAGARQRALMYAEPGKFKIKRRVQTEQGEFWRDVEEVGDY